MTENNSLVDEIRKAGKPKLNLALKPRPDVSDQAIDERARDIGGRWGAATQIVPPTEPKVLEPTAPLISVRFDCPDYLDRAIAVAAAEQNVTKTSLILQALRAAGYEIKNVDLVADRRKVRKR